MKRKPKYKVGQPIFWGNGVYQLFFIKAVNPLHCPDGGFSYRLSKIHPAFKEFTSGNRDWFGKAEHVSEDVLQSIAACMKTCK
jgi:hypothetical protein